MGLKGGDLRVMDALLVIVGPTAVGKTEVAVNLARRVKGEVISADSRQIYREMDIGTAKPSERIRKEIPHHLIDVVFPDEVFNAAEFGVRARSIIKRLQKERKLPILVGGSGLYIRAAVDGLFVGPGADWELRERLKEKARREGNESLYRDLKRIDPEAASRIHPNDQRRIIRALEVYELTGKKISSYQKERSARLSGVVMIGLERKRESLYRLINERVDRMIGQGLIEEVKSLLDKGYSEDLPSMQGLGYRQIIGYLKGDYSKEEAIRLIKRDTRRFARRQLNWFKKDDRIIWLNMEEYPSVGKVSCKILEILKKRLPKEAVAQVFRPAII